MKKTEPSIIPLSYDYQTMSPSSTLNQNTRSDTITTFYDNQYQSLFGDPVPPSPSERYLGHLDGSLYGSFRRESFASAIEDDFNRTITLATEREEKLPKIFSDITSELSPKLGPDIQILPDSGSANESGSTSSSGTQITSNFTLLRPEMVNSGIDDVTYGQAQDVAFGDVIQFNELETPTNEVKRRISNFSEDFKSNVGSLRESPPDIPKPPPRYTRQISNDSYSSTEWFRPMNAYPEFTKMPKLRPSSKNVLSIKHTALQPSASSPLASMIHDSNGSSSSEEQKRLSGTPPVPQRPPQILSLQRSVSIDSEPPIPTSPPPPLPPLPRTPLTLPPPPPDPALHQPISRQVSPIIITDSIATGAAHRVSAPRTHKKQSFTIITEKSPHSSRSPSPQKLSQTGRISPFLGYGFKERDDVSTAELIKATTKPIAKPRTLQQKSLSTSQLKLPSIFGPEDFPRPSVQFNMSGKHGPMHIPMAPHKGILQSEKDPLSSAPQIPTGLSQKTKVKSCETLPFITDPYRTAIPRLTAPTRPIFVNKNPTRKQKGLLRIISSADSASRIPIPSNWASVGDLSKPILSPIRSAAIHRRSSSSSPERRSSTQTERRSSTASNRRSSNLSSVTTSDFSFRRSSTTLLKPPKLSSRLVRSSPTSPMIPSKSERKVAKPTTLSPIIGTPNKDLPTPDNESSTTTDAQQQNEPHSKIPVRNSASDVSRSNSRMGSRVDSRVNSRSNSPFKGVIPKLSSSLSPPRHTLRPDLRSDSRSESRPHSRTDSNKAFSRSPSRASTREVSRAASRTTSRAGSRPNSRMEDAKNIANSRSNSRLSIRSEKGRKPQSPAPERRSKSYSRSPEPRKKGRTDKAATTKSVPNLSASARRKSQSRIPARVPSNSTSRNSKATTKTEQLHEPPKQTNSRKQPVSAKNPSPSSVKKRTSDRKDLKKSTAKLSTSRLPSSSTKIPTRKVASSLSTSTPAATKLGKTSDKKSSGKPVNNNKKETPSSKTKLPKGEDPTTKTRSENDKTVKDASETKPLKRQPSTVTLLSIGSKLNLLKKRSDSNLSKKLKDTETGDENSEDTDDTGNGKLVPLTKANVVSMTTAAIAAQPVQISTVLANQLPRTTSSGQLLSGQEELTLPAAILEKSTKTLENIQKTVTEATDEIHKTINENLTDLKTLENDMGRMTDGISGSPPPFEKSDSVTTIIEKTDRSSLATGTIDDAFGEVVKKSPTLPTHPIDATVVLTNSKGGHNLSEPRETTVHKDASGTLVAASDLAERVSERTISVLPEVDSESPNFQSDEGRTEFVEGKGLSSAGLNAASASEDIAKKKTAKELNTEDDIIQEAGSQEPFDSDKEQPEGCCKRSKCCKCCRYPSCLCIPCRRLRCSKCCSKKLRKPDEAPTTSVEVVDEKPSCWKKLKCCKRKPQKSKSSHKSMEIEPEKMETIREEAERPHDRSSMAPKQSKCGLCLSKVFCCRSVNKVKATTGDVEEVKKCCFCIPCRKRGAAVRTTSQSAWTAPEHPEERIEARETTAAPAEVPKQGCCSRLCQKLNCCRKKSSVDGSRRTSIKQPNVTAAEDSRRKLHVDLVEYNSKMKGAIPVMPLSLAWFCAICNTIIPGLGTLLSGFFCVCVGIPRFTQHDSAKARFGSLIINCIVSVAQLFCVLFCFVGWGWSIWWGTIMLKTARKLNKIRKVEKLEMEEEKRQAELAATNAIHNTDVEAGKA